MQLRLRREAWRKEHTKLLRLLMSEPPNANLKKLALAGKKSCSGELKPMADPLAKLSSSSVNSASDIDRKNSNTSTSDAGPSKLPISNRSAGGDATPKNSMKSISDAAGPSVMSTSDAKKSTTSVKSASDAKKSTTSVKSASDAAGPKSDDNSKKITN